MLRALRLSSPSLRLLARPLERRTCATGTSAVGTLHRKGMNLLELLSTLPNKGVGAKVYRESWVAKGWHPDQHHYLITKVVLRPTERDDRVLMRGHARGALTWQGQPHRKPSHPGKGQEIGPVRITSGPKRGEWTAIVDGAIYPSRPPRPAASESDGADAASGDPE